MRQRTGTPEKRKIYEIRSVAILMLAGAAYDFVYIFRKNL